MAFQGVIMTLETFKYSPHYRLVSTVLVHKIGIQSAKYMWISHPINICISHLPELIF